MNKTSEFNQKIVYPHLEHGAKQKHDEAMARLLQGDSLKKMVDALAYYDAMTGGNRVANLKKALERRVAEARESATAVLKAARPLGPIKNGLLEVEIDENCDPRHLHAMRKMGVIK